LILRTNPDTLAAIGGPISTAPVLGFAGSKEPDHDCRVFRRLIALGALICLVSACTGGSPDPEPSASAKPIRTSTPPTSPTPSPSRTGPLTTGPNVQHGEKPPTMPAVATHHTATGAQVFAAYYFAAYDWGYATSDPYLVQAISTSRCKACASYIKSLNQLTKNSGHISGGRVTIDSVKLIQGSFAINSDFVVEVTVDESAVILDRPNQKSETAAPSVSHDRSLVFVTWRRGAWMVTEVTGV
jgi:hypothetical protein